jgi:glycosyltransferase involved in cell wall biosynthesis
MDCVHRQPGTTRQRRGSRVIELSHCQQFQQRCVPTPDDVKLIGLKDIVPCQGCHKFVEKITGTGDWLTCEKRGEPVGRVTAAGCNCDKTIYECSVHGQCFKRLPAGRTRQSFGEELDGVTICASDCHEWKIVPAPTGRRTAAVAVVVTCHNYGRFLSDALNSLRSQTVQPAEIIVIDDASDDDTNLVTLRFEEAKYLRVENWNVFASRRAGFMATSAEFLVFLDADDTLAPNYLEDCLEKMRTDESIGIVTSDLMMFGSREGLLHHDECNLEQRNWMHAGSMVRRVSLSMCEVFDGPGPGLIAHEDWFIWRRVVRAGWKTARIDSAAYNYRQHPASMMHGSMRTGSYYDRAALHLERVTLVIPVCRERYWDRLTAWVERQSEITDIVVIDSSDSIEFRSRIKTWLAGLPTRTFRYIDRPASNGLPDRDRVGTPHYYDVQAAMPRIYRHLREVATEYIFIVEDDVLPPERAVTNLLASMDHNVAGVAGVVPSAYQKGYAISGETFGTTLKLSERDDVQTISFSGFGCLLLRRSAMLQATPFHHAGTGNYDIEFCRSINEKGWVWSLDWSVRCSHREL